MEEKQNILVLIDSNAIIHRAYHALPKNMKTSKGELTNVVYGYTTTLIKVLEDLHPTHIAASFDISKATFRLAEYKEYKAHRVAADQELYDQIPRVRNLLQVLNIPVYEMEGFEADDCIGTMVELCSTSKKSIKSIKSDEVDEIFDVEDNPTEQSLNNLTIYIVTGDKDAFQLIDGNVFVYNLKHGLMSAQIVDRDVIGKEWNLQPEDFIDLKALAGDPSDNIPGAPGIGPKTATELLIKFDTIVNLYEKIASLFNCSTTDLALNQTNDEILKQFSHQLEIKPRTLKILVEFKDQVFLSQRLATIRRDVPLDFNIKDCEWGDYDKEKVKEFFNEMQFNSLLRRFGGATGENPAKTKSENPKQNSKDEQLQLL